MYVSSSRLKAVLNLTLQDAYVAISQVAYALAKPEKIMIV